MPRKARRESRSGVYHIIKRGINKQSIFQDEEDKDIYLDRLLQCKKDSAFELYAYCLMSNHVHLLIKEGNESISIVMKRIGISYAYWYNKKYDRIGHLFQDRFRSEAVENDKYLLTVTRYIHQNPVKIGLRIDDWTSYNSYLKDTVFVDTQLILEMFSANKKEARMMFIEFMNETTNDACLDMHENGRLSDIEAGKLIKEISRVTSCQDLQYLNMENRDNILRSLKEAGISIRQIARITGLNRGVVLSA